MAKHGFDERWDEIRRIHREYNFFYILVAGLLLIAFGVWLGWQVFPSEKIIDYNINLWNTLIGTGITILVIDRLNERRAQRNLKQQLIREMASGDNGIALRANRELAAMGALQDGSLQSQRFYNANLHNALFGAAKLDGSVFVGANLEEAYLDMASLYGANLREANLRFAILEYANLERANLQSADLEGATVERAIFTGAYFSQYTKLPDGSYWTPQTDMKDFTDI